MLEKSCFLELVSSDIISSFWCIFLLVNYLCNKQDRINVSGMKCLKQSPLTWVHSQVKGHSTWIHILANSLHEKHHNIVHYLPWTDAEWCCQCMCTHRKDVLTQYVTPSEFLKWLCKLKGSSKVFSINDLPKSLLMWAVFELLKQTQKEHCFCQIFF